MHKLLSETSATVTAKRRTGDVPASNPAAMARSALIVLAMGGCAWLLLAVLAFGLLFGFVSVLLAAALTSVSFILVRRVYVEAIPGKPITVDDVE